MTETYAVTASSAMVTLTIADGRAALPELTDAVTEACDRAEDAGAGTVVWADLGGADRPAPGGPSATVHLVSRWERALRRLERLPGPLIATVHDSCSGPALEVMLTTDLRIAVGEPVLRVADDAVTVWPGMALHRLTGELGRGRARRLVLTGASLSTAQALSWGLFDVAVDPVAGPSAVADAAAMLRRMPGTDLAVLRRLLQDGTWTAADDALGAHLAACDRLLRRVATGPGR